MFSLIFHKYCIYKYKKIGTELGDLLSYAYMEALGYESPEKKKLIKKFIKAEKRIYKLGYLPYNLNSFIEAGGYGVTLPPLSKRFNNEEYNIDPYLVFELTHKLTPQEKKIWYEKQGVKIELLEPSDN